MDPERWRQVEELVHAALALEPEAQQTFLSEACGTDAELRQELESLLARRAQSARFLETYAPETENGNAGGGLLGRQIGPYRILALLGSGGMGVVYRARDCKLDRDVAMKILPDEFAGDPERLARFLREARTLASLNHPNIATMLGLEEFDGTTCLVMELVEGQTISGPLALDKALSFARQIADALASAHERGVVHRDLKPGNVMVTQSGLVKVLDFGMAKVVGEKYAIDGSDALAHSLTKSGMIVGTIPYMSPEQARGDPVDQRCDMWAFGVVLFELITGRRAFDGKTGADVLASLLTKDPDWDALPAGTPTPVRKLLQRCLIKDAKARLDSASAAQFMIADALLPAAAEVRPQVGPSRRLVIGALVASIVLLSLAAWTFLSSRSTPQTDTVRLPLTFPAALRMRVPHNDRPLAVSPDGRHIAFRTAGGQLAVRALDKLEAHVFPDIADPQFPFFSPDSRWIGFIEGNDIKKVSVEGGAPILIRANMPGRSASWADDDTIIIDSKGGLVSVPISGGPPTLLAKADNADEEFTLPVTLPSRRGVLFTIRQRSPFYGGKARRSIADSENVKIAVLDLSTRRYKTLIQGGTAAEYAGSGHLLYAIDRTLFAVRFDLTRLKVQGDAVQVVQDLQMAVNAGPVSYGVSRSGTLVYVPATSRMRSLVWVDRHGTETPVTAPRRAYQFLRLSPDGTRAAIEIREEQDIFVFDLRQETLSNLTRDPYMDTIPAWTPDGKGIVFSSTRNGIANLYIQGVDGTSGAHQLTVHDVAQFANSVTPDGRYVLGAQWSPQTNYDIFAFPIEGLVQRRNATVFQAKRIKPEPLVRTWAMDLAAMISPGGRYFAYISYESGQPEVYVRPFPGTGDVRLQISANGGSAPIWARNGKELFYLSLTGALMSVAVETAGGAFRAGAPRKLFQSRAVLSGDFDSYDVSPDGSRFLMLTETEAPAAEYAPASMVVVLNWFNELKRKLPQ